MNGLLARGLGVLLPALAGFALGSLFSQPLAPWLGAGAALLIALALIALRDTLRAHHLIDWLRGSQDGDAPRARGLWGELGYRVERALRGRDRALSLERERLTQFLSGIEASPNGVMLLDAADQIDWCNSVAAQHFGLDPRRDRLQPVTNLIRAPEFVAYLQSGAHDTAVDVPDPHGRRVISVLVRPYGDGQRLVLSGDVTERERAEAMRRDFVANVSHEIRTPLTVLAGFIDTMRNLPVTEVERQRMLELMAQQAERMGTLVGDLLTLARLEGSPWPGAERWVAVGPLLESVAADALQLSGGRHELVFPDAVAAEIAGAREELLSAVTNLVQNAIRYAPAGGTIETRWRVLTDGSGEIAVVDNGPGIAREHLPRLTERFYRVDGSRSRETGGTGLGLSIVKHVMQRHGGELRITSELGKGSTFRLVFPPTRVRAVAPGPPPAGPDAARPAVTAWVPPDRDATTATASVRAGPSAGATFRLALSRSQGF